MNRLTLSIGNILGIPVRIDLSSFLFLALVTWSLATNYFPAEYYHWTVPAYWLVSGLTAILFFGSVLFHELAHSLVAEKFKIPVRKITLYIFGGVSELKIEPANPWAEFWVAIAGPFTNLVLGGLFALFAVVLSAVGPAQATFKYLSYTNIILGLFNLVPGYPLDGGSVLMAIIWGVTHNRRRGIVVAAGIGSFVAYLLIFLGVFQTLNGNLWNGLWIAFIGWLMLSSSSGAIRRERLKEILSGHRVSEAMSKNYTILAPNTTLECLVDEHILGSSRRFFLVEKDHQLVGMLTMHVLQAFPKQNWANTSVEQAMIPLSRLITVQPATELYEAFQEMDRDGVNQLPVVEGGQTQGILARGDVISFLHRLENDQMRPRPTSL